MKKALTNIGLLAFALTVAPVLSIIGIVYGWVVHAAAFPNKAFSLSLIIDVLGNAVCAELFRDTLLKEPGINVFGVFPQTISYVLKKNKEIDNLSNTGLWLYNTIERIDPGHFSRVINY